MAPRLREVIASVPEVRGVMSHVGRPDDGTDVTSFFNLEFNAPLRPMEQWRNKPVTLFGPRALGPDDHPRGDPGRADGEVQGVPGDQLQLLAVDPRQRRGGPLRRQGGQLGQALRQRPERRWRRPASGSSTSSKTVPGIENVGLFHIVGQPNLEIQIDRERVRPLRHQRRRRRGGRPGRHRRPGLLADGRGGEALRHRPAAAPRPARRPRRHRPDPGRRSRARTASPGARIPLSQLAKIDPAQARRLLHLPREQPPLHPDQVQRPRPRPGLGHRRGPAQGRRPRDGRQAAARAIDIDWSGEFAQMQAGQRPAACGSSRSRSP